MACSRVHADPGLGRMVTPTRASSRRTVAASTLNARATTARESPLQYWRGGFAHVVVAQLAPVHSTRNTAKLEVGHDRGAVNVIETSQSVGRDTVRVRLGEVVDLWAGQASLDRV